MLTVQQLRPTVTDVKELQRRGQYIGYQEGTFIEPMLKKMGFDERRMKKYSTVEQYAVALSKGSANGGVDAVFDEIPYLKMFLSQHCDGYMQVRVRVRLPKGVAHDGGRVAGDLEAGGGGQDGAHREGVVR